MAIEALEDGVAAFFDAAETFPRTARELAIAADAFDGALSKLTRDDDDDDDDATLAARAARYALGAADGLLDDVTGADAIKRALEDVARRGDVGKAVGAALNGEDAAAGADALAEAGGAEAERRSSCSVLQEDDTSIPTPQQSAETVLVRPRSGRRPQVRH